MPYKRNEVRLTVDVPDFAIEKVNSWQKMFFLVPEVADDLSRYGDPENWVLFDGNIPAAWIIETQENVEGIEATLGTSLSSIIKTN